MTRLSLPLGAVPDLSVLLAIGVPAAVLALVLMGWAIRRGARDQKKRSGGPAVKVAALAALGCTVYSADTSWRFAADYLDMAGTAERAGMFAAAELALFATALMARQNLATQGAPGMPGTLVWVITGVQVIPAYAESGPIGGTVRAFVGPVMAAMLWHLAMGIELRLRTPGAASHGLLATLGREARERLLSRLGIAARDRDAAQITRERATRRAVTLAARLAERTPEQRTGWRGRRLTRRLSKAIGRASVGTDPAQRAELLNQLAARRHALALATVPLPSPWSPQANQAGLVPAPVTGTTSLETAVPGDGPRPHANPTGDRSAQSARGPVPGTASAPGCTVPQSGDREAWPASTEAGAEAAEPGTDRSLDSGEGTGRQMHEVPAQATRQDRGPSGAESGTDPTTDRGPTDTDTGTDPTTDRGPTDTDTGTDPTTDRGPTDTDTGTDPTTDRGPTDTDTGTDPTTDRGHMVPLRRKPSGKAKGKRGGRSRSQKAQRPSRELQAAVDQLVQQVLPHVPALLQRDGNETVTRVQLREIIRREGLTGGRNDRLSLVLQQLRSEATTTTTTRSSSR